MSLEEEIARERPTHRSVVVSEMYVYLRRTIWNH